MVLFSALTGLMHLTPPVPGYSVTLWEADMLWWPSLVSGTQCFSRQLQLWSLCSCPSLLTHCLLFLACGRSECDKGTREVFPVTLRSEHQAWVHF